MLKKFFNECENERNKIISDDLDECCICLEELKCNLLTSCCNQNIHKECLKKWCKKAIEKNELAACPICNQSFNPKYLFSTSCCFDIKTLLCDCWEGRKS